MTITIAVTDSGGITAASATDDAPDPVADGSGAHQGGAEPDRSEGAREVTGELDSDTLAAPPEDLEGTELSADLDGGAPPMALEALDAIADSSGTGTGTESSDPGTDTGADVPDD